jgi:predicted transcriptional regulator
VKLENKQLSKSKREEVGKMHAVTLSGGCFLGHKRRGRVEIMMDILDEVSSSVNKTRIVYSANLSSNMAETYLPFLIERKLLAKADGDNGVLYEITERGREILRDYRRIRELI